MAENENIARTLGRIEGTVAETRAQLAAVLGKFDKVNEEVIEHRGAMKMLALTAAEIKAAHEGLAVRVKEDVMPVLTEYTASKNRLLGAMFGTGLAGGGIGTGILLWVSKLIGATPTVPPGHP